MLIAIDMINQRPRPAPLDDDADMHADELERVPIADVDPSHTRLGGVAVPYFGNLFRRFVN